MGLFNKETLADVHFLVGTKVKKTIPAHKQILANTSEIFEDMFTQQYHMENLIEVPEIEPPVFLNLMSHLYGGKLELKERSVFKTYEAALKYKAYLAVIKCEQFILKHLISENVTLLFSKMKFDVPSGFVAKCLKKISPHLLKKAIDADQLSFRTLADFADDADGTDTLNRIDVSKLYDFFYNHSAADLILKKDQYCVAVPLVGISCKFYVDKPIDVLGVYACFEQAFQTISLRYSESIVLGYNLTLRGTAMKDTLFLFSRPAEVQKNYLLELGVVEAVVNVTQIENQKRTAGGVTFSFVEKGDCKFVQLIFKLGDKSLTKFFGTRNLSVKCNRSATISSSYGRCALYRNYPNKRPTLQVYPNKILTARRRLVFDSPIPIQSESRKKNNIRLSKANSTSGRSKTVRRSKRNKTACTSRRSTSNSTIEHSDPESTFEGSTFTSTAGRTTYNSTIGRKTERVTRGRKTKRATREKSPECDTKERSPEKTKRVNTTNQCSNRSNRNQNTEKSTSNQSNPSTKKSTSNQSSKKGKNKNYWKK